MKKTSMFWFNSKYYVNQNMGVLEQDVLKSKWMIEH